jgi:hypothetical protein
MQSPHPSPLPMGEGYKPALPQDPCGALLGGWAVSEAGRMGVAHPAPPSGVSAPPARPRMVPSKSNRMVSTAKAPWTAVLNECCAA